MGAYSIRWDGKSLSFYQKVAVIITESVFWNRLVGRRENHGGSISIIHVWWWAPWRNSGARNRDDRDRGEACSVFGLGWSMSALSNLCGFEEGIWCAWYGANAIFSAAYGVGPRMLRLPSPEALFLGHSKIGVPGLEKYRAPSMPRGALLQGGHFPLSCLMHALIS